VRHRSPRDITFTWLPNLRIAIARTAFEPRIMEPPAKRLRILKSIEVDDTNPDYIAAKEKQRAKLKGRFESLYAKYEALPEAMTDEINIRTGEIVVDRGHMRKLNREYIQRQGKRGKGSGELLDDLFRDEPEDAGNDDESTEEDVRDELAPSQSPQPRDRKQAALKLAALSTLDAGALHTSPKHHTVRADIPTPFTPAGSALTSGAQALVPIVSSPATNWMQMVQFPQTPAGQLAQSAFMQQIQHAVQQAITPILSNMLANAPISAPQYTKTTPFVPTAIDDQAASATLAMLRSPPHPESPDTPVANLSSPLRRDRPDAPIAIPSSPLPARASSPRSKRFFAKGVYINTHQSRGSLPSAPSSHAAADSGHSQAHATELKTSQSWVDDSQDNITNSIILKRNGRKRRVPASGIAEVTGAEAEVHTLTTKTKSRQPHPRKVKEQTRKFPTSEILKTSSTIRSHHLPTPDSLEHDEMKDAVEQPPTFLTDDYESLIASGGHFDDDDRDLLSIAGDDESIASDREEDYDTTKIIITSIETEMRMDYDATAQTASTVVAISDPIPKADQPRPVDSLAPPTSSPNKSKRKPIPVSFQVDSDSEDDLDLVVADSQPTGGRSTPTTHNTPAKNGRRRLQKLPQINPASNVTPLTSNIPPNQSPTSNDDELLAPFTPKIKRESCTPPASFLLATPTLHTPRSAPQPSTLQSSGAKEKATPLARSVFLKRVKQSWARGGRKAKADPGLKIMATSSFQTGKRKRAPWEDEDSEDELAL